MSDPSLRLHRRLAALMCLGFAPSFWASPAVEDGCDLESLPARLGAEKARVGTTSRGWHSDWHIKDGAARVLPDDLAIAGLHSTRGLVSSRGNAVAMRQLAESFSGEVYAIDFIESHPKDQPYFWMLPHKAVHEPFQPAPRHEEAFGARTITPGAGQLVGGLCRQACLAKASSLARGSLALPVARLRGRAMAGLPPA